MPGAGGPGARDAEQRQPGTKDRDYIYRKYPEQEHLQKEKVAGSWGGGGGRFGHQYWEGGHGTKLLVVVIS